MDRQRVLSSGAQQLAAALERAEWSQQQLEQRLGVTRGLVSRWLSGERRPGLEHALELERLLKIPAKTWLHAAA